MAPDVEFTWSDTFRDVEGVEKQTYHVGDDTKTEGSYKCWPTIRHPEPNYRNDGITYRRMPNL